MINPRQAARKFREYWTSEKAAYDNLAVFVEKLKPAGYEYFVLDVGRHRTSCATCIVVHAAEKT